VSSQSVDDDASFVFSLSLSCLTLTLILQSRAVILFCWLVVFGSRVHFDAFGGQGIEWWVGEVNESRSCGKCEAPNQWWSKKVKSELPIATRYPSFKSGLFFLWGRWWCIKPSKTFFLEGRADRNVVFVIFILWGHSSQLFHHVLSRTRSSIVSSSASNNSQCQLFNWVLFVSLLLLLVTGE
jgi:hypothetical protein